MVVEGWRPAFGGDSRLSVKVTVWHAKEFPVSWLEGRLCVNGHNGRREKRGKNQAARGAKGFRQSSAVLSMFKMAFVCVGGPAPQHTHPLSPAGFLPHIFQ